MQPEVRLEVEGPVATMTFDHQQRRNAMTKSMWEAIPPHCVELADNDDVRVVILRGAGTDAFVAGADISEFESIRLGDGGAGYDLMTAAATEALANLPQPVVAMIHGFCIGGGLALAMAADLRYASADAQFGLPPARLGIGYSPAGVAHLVDLIGPTAAKELLFTADWISAETALRWGFVNDVVAAEELQETVSGVTARMVQRAPLSQQAAKLAVAAHLAQGQHGAELTASAASKVETCYASADYREGVRAFLEKRRPEFIGQ